MAWAAEVKASARAWRMVRQRRLTSSVRWARPRKNSLTFSRTLALVPKQVLAVTSARTQPRCSHPGSNQGCRLQADQAEPQVRGAQIGAQRSPTLGRTVVPDDDQRRGMVCPHM